MIINHNLNAMNAQRNMSINTFKASKAMEKLSSGLRINRAGDDAAGLAISEKMRAQIKGLDQASRNAQDGISMIQTAEGALNETHSILQRMRELSVQASNDTNTTQDRGQIQQEVNQLTSEINRISNTTQFNTQNLLNTSNEGGKNFELQIGANKGQSMEITINNMGAKALGLTNDTKVTEFDSDKIVAAGLTVAAGTDLTVDIDSNKGLKLVSIPTGGKDETVTADDLASKLNSAIQDAGLNAKVTTKDDAGKGAGDKDLVITGPDAGKIKNLSNGKTPINLTNANRTDFLNPVTNGTDNTPIASALDLSNHTNAASAIATYDKAINTVSTERARLGAYENRLEHTINNLGTSSENLTAAESRIRDVDMAKAMMQFSKENILTQAAQAMLVQANQQPQSVLQLLR